MIRKFLLTLLCSAVIFGLEAQTISRTAARKKATQFLESKGHSASLKDAGNLKDAGEVAPYYIFNVKNNGGFVIVSGDERLEEIVGYSDQGNLSGDIPEALQEVLDGYAAFVESLGEAASTDDATTTANAPKLMAVTETAKKSISPLITTKWGQTAPYNNLCPKYYYSNGTQSSTNAVTGCVATAMAQLLNYWKTPNATTSAIPELTNTYNGSQDVTLPAVPAGTAIDWANMQDTYSSSATGTGATAVAQLMLYCGQSVNMSYANSSGASSERVPGALVNYFGFDASTTFHNASNFSIAKWENLVYGELAAGRPVYLSGQSDGGGHAFICDGYDGEGLYHINWGWKGSCDGYFRLVTLRPNSNAGTGASSSSDGYSMSRGGILGMRPAGVGTVPSYESDIDVSTSGLRLTTKDMVVNNNRIAYSIYNETGGQREFDIAFGIYDQTTGAIEMIGQYAYSNLRNNVSIGVNSYYPSSYISSGGYSLSNLSSRANGTYWVIPVSRVSGTENWLWNEGNYYLPVTVNNGSVTYSSPQVHVVSLPITVSSLRDMSAAYVNIEQELKVSIDNSSDKEYSGTIYLFASTTAEKGNPVNRTGIAIKGNSSDEFELFFTPTSAATYNIWITADANGENVLYTTQISISENKSDYSALTVSYNVPSTAYNGVVKGTMTVTNNSTEVFVSPLVLLYLYPDGGYLNSFDNTSLEDVNIAPGGSQTFNVDYTVTDYNAIYLYLYSTTTGFIGTNSSAINIVSGRNIYGFDGTLTQGAFTSSYTVPASAAAVDLRGNGTVSVNATNANPNCLYYIKSTDNVTGLNGKNVIIDGTAANITLTDGQPFYAPETFTATNISYTRTPLLGTNGVGGWETLVLPFAATSVSKVADNTETALEWFKSESETGKNLWIKKFVGIDDNDSVYFDFVQELEANQPYIIAVPGNRWGSKWNLQNVPLKFAAQNAQVEGNSLAQAYTSLYCYKGCYYNTTPSNAYAIDAEGANFVLAATASVSPFRAFFDGEMVGSGAPKLCIANGSGTTTAIATIATDRQSAEDNVVYNISGQRVNAGSALPKGVYIKNGKKFVVK